MASLTDKGKERMALLEQAESSGKITEKGRQVLDSLRQVSGVQRSVESPQEAPKKGIMDLLSLPEKKSREGLNMIAEAVSPKQEVTGNMARDIAMNLPRIAAESLADTAPGFISKEALLTGGALKGIKLGAPAIKTVGKYAAKAGESISGMEYKNAGILKKMAENPKMLFAKGKDSASNLYEAAKKLGGEGGALSEIPEKKKMVEISYKLAKKGKINPTQAFEARKQLSDIKDTVTDGFFRKATAKFNEIAKPVFSEADEAFSKGIQADEGRRLLPINKGGGTSIAKSAIGTLMGVLPTVAMSPLAQSTAAAGLGAAAKAIAPLAKNAVKSGSLLAGITKTLTEDKARELLREAKGDREKARKLAKERNFEIPE